MCTTFEYFQMCILYAWEDQSIQLQFTNIFDTEQIHENLYVIWIT